MEDFAAQNLADHFIRLLNKMVDADREAMEKLVETRVPCNQAMVDHPTVQVSNGAVGMLGILNGLVGVRDDGYGYVAAVFDDDEKLVGFARAGVPKTKG